MKKSDLKNAIVNTNAATTLSQSRLFLNKCNYTLNAQLSNMQYN